MSTADATLLGLHLAATGAMAGLIWFVQLVHYPLFGRIGVHEFTPYEIEHTRRTSRVVGPLMAAETVSAVVIAVDPPGDLPAALAWSGVALLAAIHASTLALQIPLHRQLSGGLDHTTVLRLVRSNWVRTIGWTARVGLAVAMIPVAIA